MSLKLPARLLALSLALAPLGLRAADPIALTVHADKVLNPINPMIYGHFFEHIYNGGDNGLWGEMVWNRSFEYLGRDLGQWSAKDGVITESNYADGPRLTFGDPSWTDYEYTLKARKLHGNEGFLILVRASDTEWLWVNIAGWNNTATQLQFVGGNNQDLGPRARGRVDANKWYDIKVRCEGNKVTAWLDGNKITEDTLPDDLPKAGAVGIGTWQTAAEFKDFVVKDLSGKVLYQGVPELPKVEGVGQHWETFGPGAITLDDKNALNDEHCVHIVNTGTSETGLTQANFNLKASESYKGSLFLKGSVPQGGKVRFYNAGTRLLELPLPAPTADWKEVPLEFTAPKDAPDATLEIAFSGNVDISLDQVSLMAASSIANGGFRKDIYDAFAALGPTVIRWPGGCYAEQYKWQNGIGPQSARKKNLTAMWNDYDPNALGTDEYIALCRKLQCEPLLVLNTGMHVTGTKNADEWKPWLEDALAWIDYCNGPATSKWGSVRAKNGHPEPYNVRLWEIDNELWRSLQPRPEVYAEAVKYFSAAIRKAHPEVTVIAHGGNGEDRRYDRVLLNQAADQFDILSIHHYMDPKRFDSGVTLQSSLYADVEKMIAASDNPKAKIFVSEWNAQSTDWRTGLYAGGLLNTFEKFGNSIEMATPALLFRHTSANDWDNAFINFDHKGYFVAPNYVVMKLWRDNFAPERIAVDGETGGTGKLNLVATRTKDTGKLILKAVNPTSEEMPVTATLGTFVAKSADFQLVAPGSLDARNSMDNPDTVKPIQATAALQNNAVTFSLPPYSAGVVTLTK